MREKHWQRPFRLWKEDQGGNVITIFGFSLVPILILVGATIDYTRAVSGKSQLQQATDSTVLSIAHMMTSTSDPTTMINMAQSYFSAVANDSNATIVSGPTMSTDNTQVCMSTRSTVPTTILAIANRDQITVAGTSCAKIDQTSFEIALALDNSGSMNEATSGTTKIQSLQTAASQLISTINAPGAPPRASFSLVPFTSTVNVGAGYAGASFMDTQGRSSIHWQNFQLPSPSYNVWVPTSKFDLFNGVNQAWQGCVEERPSPYTTTDTAADPNTPDTLFVPYLYPDEYDGGGSQGSLNTYLSDNGGSCQAGDTYAQADQANSSIAVTNNVANSVWNLGQTKVCKYKGGALSSGPSAFGSAFPAGPNLLCAVTPLQVLTNDSSALNAQISSMVAKGDTNLVGGMMWGWRTISPNGPFGTQTTPSGAIGPQNPQPYGTPHNAKILILMTDGYNHWANTGTNYDANGSAYSSFGFYGNGRLGSTTSSNYRSLMDSATLSACTNAKAAGVQIYTVGFSIPSDPIDSQGLSLLQSCATSANMAYIAQDGSGLITAFQSIGRAISGLRLTN